MFNKDQLLDIAYAVKLSMPEGTKKEGILIQINRYIEINGNREEKLVMSNVMTIVFLKLGNKLWEWKIK